LPGYIKLGDEKMLLSARVRSYMNPYFSRKAAGVLGSEVFRMLSMGSFVSPMNRDQKARHHRRDPLKPFHSQERYFHQVSVFYYKCIPKIDRRYNLNQVSGIVASFGLHHCRINPIQFDFIAPAFSKSAIPILKSLDADGLLLWWKEERV
jgi:hypothetical protein